MTDAIHQKTHGKHATQGRPLRLVLRCVAHLLGLIAVVIGTATVAGAQVPSISVPGSDGSGSQYQTAAGEELKGLFKIKAGTCQGTTGATGSYFQMVDPSGSPIPNNTSPCNQGTDYSSFNPLSPGTDGGLSTTGFQPHSNPVFDSSGNALSKRIVMPSKFFSVDFGLATNEKDPQTQIIVTIPKIIHDGAGKISTDSDLRAVSAAWNGNQASTTAGEGHYNQGAPKPDGNTEAPTKRASGTYNATTKAFVIEWQSKIIGGAFNGNSGKWHLEGTFDPSVTVGEAPKSPPGTTVKGAGSTRTGGVATASTGPAVPSWIGAMIFALGAGGLLLDRSMARRRRLPAQT